MDRWKDKHSDSNIPSKLRVGWGEKGTLKSPFPSVILLRGWKIIAR